MSIEVRTIAAVRDTLLGYWSAEYAANGETLLTSQGSDAYLLAGMIAVVQNACDVQAAQVAKDIFPDTASDEAISRYGYVYGVAQRPGVAARLTVDVTGTPSTVVTIPAGSQLSWTDGTLYGVTSTSVTLDVAGDGTINVTCTTVGVAGSRTVAEVLTWQSAPAGLDPTGTVASVTTSGEEAEGYQAWAQRIIGRLRERPASGNRADWKAWVEAYTALDITDVYVYPLLEPPAAYPGTGTVGVLGCVTVVAVGPAQGDSPTNTRILNGGTPPGGLELTEVKEYINGTRTATGEPTAVGTQLKPVTMSLGDISIEAISTTDVNVTVALTVTDACAFPFTSTPVIDGTSTTTSVVVVGNYGSGGIEDLSNRLAQVKLSVTVYRGAYYAVTLGTGTFAAGNTTFPVSTMPGAPLAASTLYPAPACISDVRSAVLNYFDALGPGDTTPPWRWPTEDSQGRATLYRSALVGDITDVSGVLSASLTLPAADVPSIQKTVTTLALFLVTP